MRRILLSIGMLSSLLTGAAGAWAGPGDSVQPGELRTYSTLHSIGIEWEVAGDANHNAKGEVRYRHAGSPAWRMALDLFRIDYSGWYGDKKADRAYNLGLDCYRKGDLDGAKRFWEETLSYQPGHFQAKRNLERLSKRDKSSDPRHEVTKTPR